MSEDMPALLAERQRQRDQATRADLVIGHEASAVLALSGKKIDPLNDYDAITVSASWLAYVIERRQED